MKMRKIAIVLAGLVAPLLLLGYPASTDAGNSILKRSSVSNSDGRIAAPDPRDTRIGGVTRTKASVEGVIRGRARDLERDLPVYQNEEVSTGINARAVLRFKDGSVLTIGADAEVVLDEFVYGNSGGVITLLKGALRFTSGKMGRPGLLIKMKTATIGIRGTDFWAGELKDGQGVMLMHGEVDVYNAAGMVTLREPYEGTVILSADEAPGEPTIWSDGEKQKALAAVSFSRGPLCAMLQKVAKDMFRSCT
jgi:ferric-dicitrate binding protein FerR (iron transport regulator)